MENEQDHSCGYDTVSGAFHEPGCAGECGIMNPGEAVERRRMERRKARADARKLAQAALRQDEGGGE